MICQGEGEGEELNDEGGRAPKGMKSGQARETAKAPESPFAAAAAQDPGPADAPADAAATSKADQVGECMLMSCLLALRPTTPLAKVSPPIVVGKNTMIHILQHTDAMRPYSSLPNVWVMCPLPLQASKDPIKKRKKDLLDVHHAGTPGPMQLAEAERPAATQQMPPGGHNKSEGDGQKQKKRKKQDGPSASQPAGSPAPTQLVQVQQPPATQPVPAGGVDQKESKEEKRKRKRKEERRKKKQEK
jgi:hypothetical protein